jgi:hypothetical protein
MYAGVVVLIPTFPLFLILILSTSADVELAGLIVDVRNVKCAEY